MVEEDEHISEDDYIPMRSARNSVYGLSAAMQNLFNGEAFLKATQRAGLGEQVSLEVS